MSPPQILVVEDEPLIAILMEEMLDELGYAVIGPAATLEEGLALAHSAAIDGAILDVNLNGRRSFPISEVLSQRAVPHFFATGYGSAEDVARRGVQILKKPFQIEKLAAALGRLLGDAHA